MRAAQKRNATRGDLLTALIILFFAAVVLFSLLSGTSRAATAQVLLDGEVIFSCCLDELEEPFYYSVPQATYPLTLEFSKVGVKVTETNCPGEDCRHTGTIATSTRQIICLPNRLIVSLGGDDSYYDAIVG